LYGKVPAAEEKTKTAEMAQKFINDASDGRDADMPIITVNAGSEPPMFTQHFLGWDPLFMEKHSFKDPYNAKVASMQAAQAKAAEAQAALDKGRTNFSDPLAERRAQLAAEEEAKRAAAALLADSSQGKKAFVDPLTQRRASMAAAEDARRAALLAEGAAAGAAAGAKPTNEFTAKGPFTAAELKGRVPGVDPTKKETYLSDEEFATLFQCSRTEFAAQPAWKTKAAKQKFGLF
jgi:hypothetical protein